jgi:hypothetical protein
MAENAGDPITQKGDLTLAFSAYETALSELEKRALAEKR